MYRIVFRYLCPRTGKLVYEHGPWHAQKSRVQHWFDYLEQHGYAGQITIENMSGHSGRTSRWQSN